MKQIMTVCAFVLVLACPAVWAQEPAVLIQKANVVQQKVSEVLTVYGSVQPAPDAVLTISLSHAGLVTRVGVRLGQRVRRGALLIELTTAPAARMQYIQAHSAEDFAQRELDRLRRLLKEQLATKAQVDSARKALADAHSSQKALKAQGQNEKIERLNAPADGIVTYLGVKQGDRVQADAAALAIATGKRLVAVLGVEPEDIRHLKPGAFVLVKSVFVPEYEAKSHLGEIHAMINPTTHLVDALVPIPADQTDDLVLGSRLVAEIHLNAHTAITVARSAVLQDQQGSYVFRIINGRAHRTAVSTGLAQDQWIEITDGLQPGDAVVSVGNYVLQDGMPVREGR